MKSMKKSMVVTTVLMVALLIVALSTATFAWYTSQSSVGVTETTVTAATTDAASLAIDSSNTGAAADKTSVSITMKDVGPMIPKAVPTVGTTTYTSGDDSIAFNSCPVDQAGTFVGTSAVTTPNTPGIDKINLGSSDLSQDYFYVINTNKDNATGITVKVTFVDIPTKTAEKLSSTTQPADWTTATNKYFSDEKMTSAVDGSITNYEADTYYLQKDETNVNDQKLRVAIFADDKLVEIWSQAGNNTYCATIVGTEAANSITTTSNLYNSKASDTVVTLAGNVAALGGVKVQVVAWYEGTTLYTADAGNSAKFTVTFGLKDVE